MTARRNVALFFLLAALWGTAFVATKAALATVPPVVLAAVRFYLAAAVLFGVVLVVEGGDVLPRGRGDWAPILAGGVFSIGAHHALLFAGQQYVTSAVAATLLGLVPVLTPAATRVLRPTERLSARGFVGVLAGFAGVVLIANPDVGNLAASTGVWLVLAAAVAWVFGAVLTDEDDAALPGVALQAWMLLVGAVALNLAVFALPGESLAAATFTTDTVWWVLYLAVVPGALGFLLYFRLLHRLGPIQMGLVEYVIPPFAALFGWLVLGESLSATTVYGFLAIVVGFLLVKGGAIRTALRRWQVGDGGAPEAD